MVRKLGGKAVGKAANAATKAAKAAAKEAAGSVKRNVVDEATKPMKDAAKKKMSALTCLLYTSPSPRDS